MNQIKDPPNNYDFGLDFNYAVWTPGTILSLVNVPWNNDYRDIVRFTNRAALDTYIDGRESSGVRITKMSYVKPNMPIRINLPINKAINFNYLRASNPLQPVPNGDVVKNYYYFITDAVYVSPNTTELTVQLDIWQTFGYDITFGNAFVERGHIGIANENAFDSFGRDYLTVPEGLNIGNEYRVVTKRTEEVVNANPLDGTPGHHIMVLSTADLEESGGTVTDPELKTGPGSTVSRLTSGATAYMFKNNAAFSGFLYDSREKPWITQGIISITLVPELSRYNITPTWNAKNFYRVENLTPDVRVKSAFTDWRNSSEISNYIEARYRHLKKLFTFPYMIIEMTTWSGNPVILKPEAWNNADARFTERCSYMPPNQRVQFYPRGYNSSGQEPEYAMNLTQADIDQAAIALDWSPAEKLAFEKRFNSWGDDFGDYLDVVAQLANFPTMPVVNNMAINYLASNNSSIAFQRQSAGWSQQKALNSASTGFDQATKGIETSRALNEIAVNADISQTGNINRTMVAQNVVSGAASLIGGAATGGVAGGMRGGPGGAVAGAALGALSQASSVGANLINAGIQTQANDEALAIRNAAAAGNIDATTGQQRFIRDTNKSLADWAARGDYANQIAGINARVEDAEMIQPSMSGQYGGDAANFAYGTMEMSLRWKLIDNANIRRVGEFWLRYGYAINSQLTNLPSDMMVMSKFTYWKLAETYIVAGAMPESIKQSLRGLFEKGVTVWRDPGYIGTTDLADNEPIAGISY